MASTAPAVALPLSDPDDPHVSAMVSTLVHDLRQPLSVIEACADYLDLVLPATDLRIRQQLELLQEQVTDANRIMHEALVMLHFGDAEPRPLTASASLCEVAARR
jgi:signal transduction histidine kinase